MLLTLVGTSGNPYPATNTTYLATPITFAEYDPYGYNTLTGATALVNTAACWAAGLKAPNGVLGCVSGLGAGNNTQYGNGWWNQDTDGLPTISGDGTAVTLGTWRQTINSGIKQNWWTVISVSWSGFVSSDMEASSVSGTANTMTKSGYSYGFKSVVANNGTAAWMNAYLISTNDGGCNCTTAACCTTNSGLHYGQQQHITSLPTFGNVRTDKNSASFATSDLMQISGGFAGEPFQYDPHSAIIYGGRLYVTAGPYEKAAGAGVYTFTDPLPVTPQLPSLLPGFSGANLNPWQLVFGSASVMYFADVYNSAVYNAAQWTADPGTGVWANTATYSISPGNNIYSLTGRIETGGAFVLYASVPWAAYQYNTATGVNVLFARPPSYARFRGITFPPYWSPHAMVTYTPTNTASVTSTASSSATTSPTITPASSLALDASRSSTNTPTPSVSPSSTATPSPSGTRTSSITPSTTPSNTATPSNTKTSSPTPTKAPAQFWHPELNSVVIMRVGNPTYSAASSSYHNGGLPMAFDEYLPYTFNSQIQVSAPNPTPAQQECGTVVQPNGFTNCVTTVGTGVHTLYSSWNADTDSLPALTVDGTAITLLTYRNYLGSGCGTGTGCWRTIVYVRDDGTVDTSFQSSPAALTQSAGTLLNYGAHSAVAVNGTPNSRLGNAWIANIMDSRSGLSNCNAKPSDGTWGDYSTTASTPVAWQAIAGFTTGTQFNADLHSLVIYNGNLFASTGPKDALGAGLWMYNGLPTVPAAATALPGFTAPVFTNPWQFFFVDANTVWFADVNKTSSYNAQKFTNVSGTWVSAATASIAANVSIYTLIGRLEGSSWILYATSPSAAYSYNTSSSTVFKFATPASTSLFRGITFAPSAIRPVVAVSISSTATQSPSPSIFSPTQSPTGTRTSTPSPSVTATSTAASTTTSTSSASGTSSASSTASSVPTPTNTRSPGSSPTSTPPSTASSSNTATSTASPSNTASSTASPSTTGAGTQSSSNTASASASASSASTQSSSRTPAATRSSTATPYVGFFHGGSGAVLITRVGSTTYPYPASNVTTKGLPIFFDEYDPQGYNAYTGATAVLSTAACYSYNSPNGFAGCVAVIGAGINTASTWNQDTEALPTLTADGTGVTLVGYRQYVNSNLGGNPSNWQTIATVRGDGSVDTTMQASYTASLVMGTVTSGISYGAHAVVATSALSVWQSSAWSLHVMNSGCVAETTCPTSSGVTWVTQSHTDGMYGNTRADKYSSPSDLAASTWTSVTGSFAGEPLALDVHAGIIYDGRLYVTGGAFDTCTGCGAGVYTFPDPLPTTPQLPSLLPGFSGAGIAPWQLVFASSTVMWVADVYNVASYNAGKYSLINGVWKKTGTALMEPAGANIYSLTGRAEGDSFVLYGTTRFAAYQFNTGSGVSTVIARPSAGTAFRGITLVPINPAAAVGTYTNTATQSRTASTTPTGTASSSMTPSGTASSSTTSTSASTGTPAETSSPSATSSPSGTPSSSGTPAVTTTPAETATSSVSGTPESTPTPVESSTPVETPTPAETATSSVSGTSASSVTPSVSGTPESSVTPSVSGTSAVTTTPAPTDSSTSTPSRTSTSTAAASKSRGASSSASGAKTMTPSSTAAKSITPVPTTSPAATKTPTVTRTETSAATHTRTASPDATDTATVTKTKAPTKTPTDTPAASKTSTKSPAATKTPTKSPAATKTSAASKSGTAKSTPTSTGTKTPAVSKTAVVRALSARAAPLTPVRRSACRPPPCSPVVSGAPLTSSPPFLPGHVHQDCDAHKVTAAPSLGSPSEATSNRSPAFSTERTTSLSASQRQI